MSRKVFINLWHFINKKMGRQTVYFGSSVSA